MAQLHPTTLVLATGVDFKKQIAELDRLQERSDALAPGQLEGLLFSHPVADGKAYYLVTKAEPLELQHVDFLDGYALPAAHIRGLEKEDLTHFAEMRRRLVDLVNRQRPR